MRILIEMLGDTLPNDLLFPILLESDIETIKTSLFLNHAAYKILCSSKFWDKYNDYWELFNHMIEGIRPLNTRQWYYHTYKAIKATNNVKELFSKNSEFYLEFWGDVNVIQYLAYKSESNKKFINEELARFRLIYGSNLKQRVVFNVEKRLIVYKIGSNDFKAVHYMCGCPLHIMKNICFALIYSTS